MAQVFKSAEKAAARAGAAHPGFDPIVARIEAMVRAEASRHDDTGAFSASIRVVRGRTDRHIVAEDPLAWHKEFGHLLVEESSQAARWVPGNFVLTNVAKAALR